MSQRDPKVYLDDILDAAHKATGFVEGLSFDEFAGDDRTAFAVVRALEIVGEAAKGVPASLRERTPDIPWLEMTGMRDKLIHAYQAVDLRVVWRTVKEDLPTVAVELRELLDELDDEE